MSRFCTGLPIPQQGETNKYMANTDPRLTRAYAEGKRDKMGPNPNPSNNPHPVNTEAYAAWQRGWNAIVSPDGPIKGYDCTCYPNREAAP